MKHSDFKPTQEIHLPHLVDSKIWINRSDNIPNDSKFFSDFSTAFNLTKITNDKRIRELFHGRFVSKSLITKITGEDPGWFPIGENGRPVLPSNILASFTHSQDWVAVWSLLKTENSPRSIGIDLQTWIPKSECLILQEGFRRRSFRMPVGIPSRFSIDQQFTIIFSILESIQKILGNANEAFISIDKLKLELSEKTWQLREHPKLNISGYYEACPDFVLTYGHA